MVPAIVAHGRGVARVLLEHRRVRLADGVDLGGARQRGAARGADLHRGRGHALLEAADRREEGVEPRAVTAAHARLQRGRAVPDVVEGALLERAPPRGQRIRRGAGVARGRRGRARRPDEAIEDRLRADDLVQRRRRIAPGDAARVLAWVAVGVRVQRREADLQRRQRGRAADRAGDRLVDGDAAAATHGAVGLHARPERGAEVAVRRFDVAAPRRIVRDAAQEEHLRLHGRERLEDRRELPPVAHAGRCRVVGGHAAVRVEHRDVSLSTGARLPARRARVQGLEPRERERDAGASEHRTPRKHGHLTGRVRGGKMTELN